VQILNSLKSCQIRVSFNFELKMFDDILELMITFILRFFLTVSIIIVPFSQGVIAKSMTSSSTIEAHTDCTQKMLLNETSCDNKNCLNSNCSFSTSTFFTTLLLKNTHLIANNSSKNRAYRYQEKVPFQVPIPIYRPPIT